MTEGESPLRHAQVLRLALLAGPLLFAGVIWFLTQDDGLAPESGAALDTVAEVLLVLVPFLALLQRAQLRRNAARADAAARDARWLEAGLIPTAILEGGTLFELVAWMLTGEPLPYAVYAAALWGLNAALPWSRPEPGATV